MVQVTTRSRGSSGSSDRIDILRRQTQLRKRNGDVWHRRDSDVCNRDFARRGGTDAGHRSLVSDLLHVCVDAAELLVTGRAIPLRRVVVGMASSSGQLLVTEIALQVFIECGQAVMNRSYLVAAAIRARGRTDRCIH